MTTVVGIILAVMGVGTIALLVAKNAQTGNVLTTAGGSIGQMICTALSPVTGATCGGLTPNVTSTITFP